MREGAGEDPSRVGEVVGGRGTERSGATERPEWLRGAGRGREAEARELGSRRDVGEVDLCLGSRIPIFGKVEGFDPNLENYL